MSYFFTGDPHLWHENIIRLACRPFSSSESMAAVLQSNINEVVTKRDRLVILGDLALGRPEKLEEWIVGLNTKNIHVVWGNHDDTAKRLAKRKPKLFQRTGDVLEYQIPWPGRERGVHIFCSHYAHRVWNKSHHGSYHLYGHSHGSLPYDPNARSMDVGVDTNRYMPWRLEDIIERLDKKRFVPVDQHGDMSRFSGKTICALCGMTKFYHEDETLQCPRTIKQPGPGRYHPTQYFAPKRGEAWLGQVLTDAKEAHAYLPDWAKSGS